MQQLYAQAQISKQGHYQALVEEQKWQQLEKSVVGLMLEIREIHPAMGLRTMYEFYQPADLGRDAFIGIGLAYGFRVKSVPNATRTTFASPYSRYANLLVNKTLTDINQLWTSDLTYFRLGEAFCYLVFILDVYSRRIVGYSLADNMRAENQLKALQMAFKTRKQDRYAHQLIHHSDRGGQYISLDYTNLLAEAQMLISMCNEVYENAHIERVNGTIKNQYLMHWNITSFEQLQTQLKRAVQTYNQQRPHSALGGLTPLAFEQHIKELNQALRPKLRIWTSDQSKNNSPNQCIIPF